MRLSPRSDPLPATLAATAVLLALRSAPTPAAARWHALGPLLKGRPAQRVRDGRLDERALKRHGVGRGDLEEAVRASGKGGLEEVRDVWIERNGHISVLGRSSPVTARWTGSEPLRIKVVAPPVSSPRFRRQRPEPTKIVVEGDRSLRSSKGPFSVSPCCVCKARRRGRREVGKGLLQRDSNFQEACPIALNWGENIVKTVSGRETRHGYIPIFRPTPVFPMVFAPHAENPAGCSDHLDRRAWIVEGRGQRPRSNLPQHH